MAGADDSPGLSMPIASKPVRIGDSAYLDGGIADSIPYEYMESIGYSEA